jgi:hypothetical protein
MLTPALGLGVLLQIDHLFHARRIDAPMVKYSA